MLTRTLVSLWHPTQNGLIRILIQNSSIQTNMPVMRGCLCDFCCNTQRWKRWFAAFGKKKRGNISKWWRLPSRRRLIAASHFLALVSRRSTSLYSSALNTEYECTHAHTAGNIEQDNAEEICTKSAAAVTWLKISVQFSLDGATRVNSGNLLHILDTYHHGNMWVLVEQCRHSVISINVLPCKNVSNLSAHDAPPKLWNNL